MYFNILAQLLFRIPCYASQYASEGRHTSVVAQISLYLYIFFNLFFNIFFINKNKQKGNNDTK